MDNQSVESQLQALREEVGRLRGEIERGRQRRARLARRLFWPLLAGLLAFTATSAAQLVTFTGGEPALASEINANFAQLQTWIEQKVGAVNDPNVTVDGTFTANDDVTVTGQLDVGSGAATRIGSDGRIMNNMTHTSYDVWIQGAHTTAGGDSRNLALLGVDEDSGDTLYLNYQSEYAGGTIIDSSATVDGDLTVNGIIDIGLELKDCGYIGSGENCSCPSGKRLLGGGAYCEHDNEHIAASRPVSLTEWDAWCEDASGTNLPVRVYVICARL